MTRIWAVARHTIAEAVRMRVALFFISLLALLIFGVPFVARGDGTLSGSVRSFMTYSFAAVSFLLALLTLFMSRSLSDELVNRQILILMAKPLPRWQYMVGKWFGVVLFDALLLAVSAASIYGMVRYMAWTIPPRDPLDAAQLKTEILTARHRSSAQEPREMFERTARATFEQRKEEGLYADVTDLDAEKAVADLTRQIKFAWRTVLPGGGRVLEFNNVRCDRSEGNTIQIRYKCSAANYPMDEVIRTLWIIGDPDKVQPYVERRRDVRERFHTFSVPAGTVADDGTLVVVLQNVNPYVDDPAYPNELPTACVLQLDDQAAAEVMFAVGSFEGNLLRLTALILFRLMFLAALGLMTTSVFSFPVASLVSLTIYVMASARGFIQDALEFLNTEGFVGAFQVVFGFVFKTILFVIPDFPAYNGLEVFTDGRNVTLMWVLQGFFWVAVVQTGIMLLLACLLFHRREVSEVSI